LFAYWQVFNAEKSIDIFEQISAMNTTIINADLQKWQEADQEDMAKRRIF